MGAREGMIVGGALLAFSFLASAAPQALEPVQSGSSAGSSSAPMLPAFLDDDRLPALQEAWRANVQGPETGALPAEPSPVANAPSAGDESAATVRERAEELSRRFGVTTGPAAKTPPPSVTIPPAVIPAAAQPEIKPGRAKAAVKPVMPARKSAMHPANTDANPAYPTDTASTEKDFSAEKSRLAAPPPPPESIPPLPRRAPQSRSATAAATKASVTRPGPAHTYRSTTSVDPTKPPPDPKAALRGTILTNELRAFGWNSQPH